MAREKIQVIRDVELECAKSIREANSKKDSIINEAKQKAEKIEQDMIEEINLKSEKTKNETELRNQSAISEAINNAQIEIEKLKKLVTNKKEQASKIIMEEII